MKVSRIFTRIAPVAVALMTLAGPVHARGPGRPCRPDIQALCPKVTPGPGNFRDCLRSLCPDVTPGPGGFSTCLRQAAQAQNHPLSSACQQHLSEVQARIDAWQTACGGDVSTYCSNVTGPRNIFKCLRQHKDQLSQTCKDQLAQHHWRRRHHQHDRSTPTPGSASSTD